MSKDSLFPLKEGKVKMMGEVEPGGKVGRSVLTAIQLIDEEYGEWMKMAKLSPIVCSLEAGRCLLTCDFSFVMSWRDVTG